MSYIPIVSTVDDNYAQHYGVMLQSALSNKKNDTEYGIYIINAGLSSENTRRLAHIARFFGHELHILDLNDSKLAKCSEFPVSRHIRPSSYFRLFIGSILPPSVAKILYLDCDMVILDDLSDLFATDLSDVRAACVPDKIVNRDRHGALALSNGVKYFNAGVMLINIERWRLMDTENKLVDFIYKNYKNIRFHDQDALNAVLNGDYKELPQIYNFFSYLMVTPRLPNYKISIIHYVGSLKPWHFRHSTGSIGKYYEYLSMTPWRDYVARHRSWSNFTQRIKKLGKIHKLLSFNN